MTPKRIITYDDFEQLIVNAVLPLNISHPEYVRLDGSSGLASRKPFAYFKYNDYKWKVDQDTYIDKLKLAYKRIAEGEDPFIKRRTRGGKGECLIIEGEPVYGKMFYVYMVSKL